ncbi:MAG: carboxypeptidase-like regulatory domain-containing protein [Saprospiraceae bacterium]
MKPTTYTFDIPTPCHEKWINMDQRPNGRFCQTCQKTVIDFSNKSDREVAAYFQKTNENVCGKFRQDQLRRPVHFEQAKTLGRRLRALGLLVPGLLVGGAATGQNLEKPLTEQLEIDHSLSLLGYVSPQPIKRVKGVVKNEYGDPLIGVTVMVKNTALGTVTDINGEYEINVPIPQNGSDAALEFSYTGFHSVEVHISLNSIEGNNVVMSVNPVMTEGQWTGLLGVVAVRRDQTLYNIVKNKIQHLSYTIHSYLKEKRKEKTAKKLIEKKEENNIEIPENKSEQLIKKENNYAGKIFPNPFSQQINIEINCPKNEPLNIRLLDLNGRIIFSQKYDAGKGGNTISISPNLQNMAAANYMLEISGADGLYLAEMVVYSNGN